MPLDPAALDVIASYGSQATALRARVLAFIERAWGSLDAWRDADIARFVAAVVPVVETGQIQTAALTDAYLAAIETTVTGLPVRPIGIAADLVTDPAVRGVPTAAVYARTGPTVWTALKDGAPIEEAAQRGLQRALSMASMDVQLAKTHTSRHVLASKDHVTGYRRVLTGSKSCGLCAVASSQRYRKQNLLPVHPGCDCGIAPIYGRTDPGQVVDPNTLADIHQAIADRFGVFDESGRARDGIPNYRDVLVTHNHGELGPVLGVKGQRFTGPRDL